MNIKTAIYIGSYVELKKCPPPLQPEFAFAGRSNVGKSSLINMLTGFTTLAKISVRPGKTQTMNYFLINEKWYLVDLPGYGYAKTSKKMREKWDKMIKGYLLQRETLKCVFQLIDHAIEPQQIDIEFSNWMGENGIPFVLIFTKSDKRNKSGKIIGAKAYTDALSKYWEHLPEQFITSAKNKKGREDILKFIATHSD